MINTMPYLSNELIFAVVAGVVAIIFIVLYIREYYLRQQNLTRPNEVLEESEEKGLNIIHDAIKKSEDILSQAELEGVKTASSSEFHTAKLEKEYLEHLARAGKQAEDAILSVKQQFDTFLDQLRDAITESKVVKQSEMALTKTATDVQESLNKTESGFSQFLEELKTSITSSQASSQELIKQQVNQQFEKFEQNLSDFLTQTEQQSTKAVELEVKSARQLIDSYKSQQLSLIDENIVAMLEKTLSLVLTKKLSLKDQIDIVYESLEKAKTEKFIA